MPQNKSSNTPDAGRVVVLPLEEFYAASGFPPPVLTKVEANELPEHFQALLAQQQDMTPMLEKYYQQPVHLRILGERRKGDFYSREYVLLLDEDQRLVGFGGIKINLTLLNDDVQRLIMEGRRPLGHILDESKISYHSQPGIYFHLTSGPVINPALNLFGPHVLYGRCSTLIIAKDRPLAEVVDVLPPANR